MTVQEIFNTKAIKEIEQEILSVYFDVEKGRLQGESQLLTIRKMLEVRKSLLDDMFEMNEAYKTLLYEFNEALSLQMIEMRKRTIALYQATKALHLPGSYDVEGKCLLGYGYSKIHPVQNIRAKKMWAILNGCLDNYNPLYDDGSGSFRISSRDKTIDTENEMLYLGNGEIDNFNEGLDREMTKDMHLIFPFHDLYEHMEFSIFDLLWVRDFNIELKVEVDYNTYLTEDYCDDLDWGKCDFYD